jgi:hypothetical protein
MYITILRACLLPMITLTTPKMKTSKVTITAFVSRFSPDWTAFGGWRQKPPVQKIRRIDVEQDYFWRALAEPTKARQARLVWIALSGILEK